MITTAVIPARVSRRDLQQSPEKVEALLYALIENAALSGLHRVLESSHSPSEPFSIMIDYQVVDIPEDVT
jgi:hypothetical protein